MYFIQYFIYLLFSLNNYFVDCAFGGFNAYPSQQFIQQKSKIIVEGYFFYSQVIDSIDIKYPIYLSSDKGNVDLKIIDYNKGMYHISQVILEPVHELELGVKYTLQIDNLPSNIKIERWNSETKNQESYSWLAKVQEEQEIIEWVKKPNQVDEIFNLYGCGPEVYAVFDVAIKSESSIFVETEFKNISTNEINSFWLQLDREGDLKVGHGMCVGAFYFQQKQDYRIRFKLQNLKGDPTPEWTEWQRIKSPL